ncbi:MAG: GAF domain-containing protein [Candidatus Eisenbacteria bacterium]
MSRFDLRDVSDRLTRSRDTKSVVFEFLRSLEAARSDWRASLAFYEVSQDAFVDVFEVEGNRLIRREIVVRANELPERLVRKLFDASAIFNAPEKPSLFSGGLGTAPCYVAEDRDASELMPLTVLSDWRSCICLPLGDQSDLIGILVITSAKKNAFGGRAVSEILPVKSLVTVALAKHLQRAGREAPAPQPTREAEAASEAVTEAAAELRAQLDTLTERSRQLDQEERSRGEMLANLTSEYEERQRSSDEYRVELDRVKSIMAALEAQSVAATEHLAEAYTEMNDASWEMADLERRVDFARRFLQLLGQEPDERRLPMAIVGWLSSEFGIERCSLMTLDASREVLQISAQCGIDAGVAERVRVRVGQGVAGWVAHNRKPLLVRMRSQAEVTPEAQADTYNSPSFIAVPVVHNGRLYGVLNLSNKQGGELFNGVDFDCASLAGAALAVRLASCEPARSAAARAA